MYYQSPIMNQSIYLFMMLRIMIINMFNNGRLETTAISTSRYYVPTSIYYFVLQQFYSSHQSVMLYQRINFVFCRNILKIKKLESQKNQSFNIIYTTTASRRSPSRKLVGNKKRNIVKELIRYRREDRNFVMFIIVYSGPEIRSKKLKREDTAAFTSKFHQVYSTTSSHNRGIPYLPIFTIILVILQVP